MQIRVRPAEEHEEKINAKTQNDEKNKKSTMLLTFLQKCSTDSTLHGIRYLFESDSFLIRKVLWLLVIFACTAFCIQQFYVRITRFVDNPQIVDMEIVYANQHDFPQVTICNNNQIKSTKLLQPGTYDYMKQFFQTTDFSDPVFIQQLRLGEKMMFEATGTYLNLTEQYILNRHEVKDLIFTCRFRGRPCSPENFAMVFTDYGACYQFRGDGSPLVVTNAGSGTGLTLDLNVEQYAYMYGPHYSAGLLALIQDSREIPMIEGKAIVVPAGGEIFLGLDLTQVDLLPPPIGDCSSKNLQYFSEYSVSACNLECLTDYVVNNCACKLGFMPGNTSLCRVVAFFACATPFIKNFTQSTEAENCNCPPSCSEKIYTTSMTFAPTSDFNAKSIAQFLTTTRSLLSDYVAAQGVFDYHFNAIQKNQDMTTLKNFAPFLSEFAAAALAIYPKLNSLNDLLSALNQLILVKNPASSITAVMAQSVMAVVKNVTLMIQSVDPSVYGRNPYAKDVNDFLKLSLETGNRLWLFNQFRMDSNQSNNATTLLYLQQSVAEWMQLIDQGVQGVVQLVGSSGLAALSPVVTVITQNLSNSLIQLKVLNIVFESSLQNMVSAGLPAISKYSAENVPLIESVIFDPDFVRSNFMRLEIFFKEMRYQQIQKELSDSVVSLLCDLGGTFGLCLGASIMSIYEFFDFFICYLKMKSL